MKNQTDNLIKIINLQKEILECPYCKLCFGHSLGKTNKEMEKIMEKIKESKEKK